MRPVLLLGASGTVGRAVAAALAAEDVAVLAPVRRMPDRPVAGIRYVAADPGDRAALARALSGETLGAVISCLASRTGSLAEAWAIDHAATVAAVDAARDAGAETAVLVSAICVQKPRLAFQHAKLAAEAHVRASGMRWSIVRPTALFKSLSGQIARVQAGRPWLLFGNGALTATKPISDRDLARYIVGCLTDPALANRVLPVGGPGPAETPREMALSAFRLAGRAPRFRSVTPRLLTGIAGALDLAGAVAPSLRDKAEFARIGHYYATESMLVWDSERARYDAGATPETGSDRISDHFARLLSGDATADLGAHAVFDRS